LISLVNPNKGLS